MQRTTKALFGLSTIALAMTVWYSNCAPKGGGAGSPGCIPIARIGPDVVFAISDIESGDGSRVNATVKIGVASGPEIFLPYINTDFGDPIEIEGITPHYVLTAADAQEKLFSGVDLNYPFGLELEISHPGFATHRESLTIEQVQLKVKNKCNSNIVSVQRTNTLLRDILLVPEEADAL